jgi:SAM-dependent methyltransferase
LKSETGSLYLVQIILDQVPLRSQHVLAVGCGDGEFTAVLAQKAAEVLGIDIDALAIAAAKSKYSNQEKLVFQIGDAECLDESIDDLTFDCIVSVFTLHHTDLLRSLEGMKKHLTSNGKMIIVDFYASRKHSFASHLLDQLLFSHLRAPLALLRTIRKVGIVNVLRFLRWRVKLSLSPKARGHMRQDYAQGLPPSLTQWRNYLQTNLPGGLESILMGSVFMYSWNKR